MGTVAVFIDGAYFDKVLKYDHNNSRIDYSKIGKEVAKPDTLFRVYYYHCLPYQSKNPSDPDKKWYSDRHKFMTALSYLPRFEVRFGRLAYRGTDISGEPILQQKRVDCMVGVDMALLAGKGKITNLTLISGDSDFIPAIEAVKNEGVIVTLWHGNLNSRCAPARELYQICDERREITSSLIQALLRAN